MLFFSNTTSKELINQTTWEQINQLGLSPIITAAGSRDQQPMYMHLIARNSLRVEKLLAEHGELIPSLELIQKAHKILMSDIHPQDGGVLRTKEVPLVHLYGPPAAGRIRHEENLKAVEQRFMKIHGDPLKTSPEGIAESLAVYHIGLKEIQLFNDGNGRMGRLILDSQMDHLYGTGLRPPIDSKRYHNAMTQGLFHGNTGPLAAIIHETAQLSSAIFLKPDHNQQMKHALSVNLCITLDR